MSPIRLCSVDREQDHLIEVPLQQAQIPFTLNRGDGKTVVLIAQDDIDRARAGLPRADGRGLRGLVRGA